ANSFHLQDPRHRAGTAQRHRVQPREAAMDLPQAPHRAYSPDTGTGHRIRDEPSVTHPADTPAERDASGIFNGAAALPGGDAGHLASPFGKSPEPRSYSVRERQRFKPHRGPGRADERKRGN